MVIPSTLDERVVKRLNSAARKAAARHLNYASEGDMRQEAYLWVLNHHEKVSGLIEDESWGILSNELFRAANRFGLKQRYLKDGTKPGDYFNYTGQIIAELLPEVMGGSPDPGSSSDLNMKIRGKKPINEAGDRNAMMVDVHVAYKKLNEYDKQLLWQRYSDGGVTEEVMGALMEMPQQTVSYQIRRALRRMAESLDVGKGDPHEGRRAMSNARAQITTRQQNDG